jgi:hypothetical protein
MEHVEKDGGLQGEEGRGRETGGKRERAERRPGVIDYEGDGEPI